MMNSQTEHDQISIADKLLKQLEDEYMALLAHNMPIPKQNIEPEDDPQNPYQPLDFDDQQENQQQDQQFVLQQPQKTQQNQASEQPYQDKSAQLFIKQIQRMRVSQQIQSNPENQELIEVPPTDQSIFTNLPHKDFKIDEDKIKTFTLSLDIQQPEWLKDQNLCMAKIEQLFTKKPAKPFTKI